MVFGHKANGSSNKFGHKNGSGNSLGHKLNTKKKDHHFNKNHEVEETRTVSHDQGPDFLFNHKHKDNTHSVHNDLERFKTPRKDKQERTDTFI